MSPIKPFIPLILFTLVPACDAPSAEPSSDLEARAGGLEGGFIDPEPFDLTTGPFDPIEPIEPIEPFEPFDSGPITFGGDGSEPDPFPWVEPEEVLPPITIGDRFEIGGPTPLTAYFIAEDGELYIDDAYREQMKDELGVIFDGGSTWWIDDAELGSMLVSVHDIQLLATHTEIKVGDTGVLMNARCEQDTAGECVDAYDEDDEYMYSYIVPPNHCDCFEDPDVTCRWIAGTLNTRRHHQKGCKDTGKVETFVQSYCLQP